MTAAGTVRTPPHTPRLATEMYKSVRSRTTAPRVALLAAVRQRPSSQHLSGKTERGGQSLPAVVSLEHISPPLRFDRIFIIIL
jgi:hypothetical protein